MRKVAEVMTKNPVCCTPDMDLVEAAGLMLKYNCGEIPVVYNLAETKVLGIITDRDICIRSVALGLNPLSMHVEQCMSQPAVVVKKTTTVEDCCQIMEERQIRRIPVVDENENCCGIVSLADLVGIDEWNKAQEVVKKISQPLASTFIS